MLLPLTAEPSINTAPVGPLVTLPFDFRDCKRFVPFFLNVAGIFSKILMSNSPLFSSTISPDSFEDLPVDAKYDEVIDLRSSN